MKKSIYTAIFTSVSALVLAQTLPQTILKTDNERFAGAASDLLILISKEPAKGENYFYFGENYFKRGALDKFQNSDLDSAYIYYTKGVELNATNALNYVGLGKVLLQKNKVAEAKTQFFKAASISQNKSAEVMRRTAEAWISTDNKNPDEAITQINNAIKLEPKNPENYILLGDAQLEKNPSDGSGPIKSYQMASTLDAKSVRGILREGKLYQRGRNYNLALEKYKAALTIDPTFAPAYREIAELYFLAAQNGKSIENWKKYLELNNSDYAHYRFMSALFKNKQYPEAIVEYENLKKSNFNNLYLERIASFCYYQMGDKTDKDAYTKGMTANNTFFEKAGPNFKYIADDYKYKGFLLSKIGKDSLGVIEMEKAIRMDSSIAGDIYSFIATAANKNKRYDKVIIYLEKKDTAKMDNNDWYTLGKAYFFTAQTKLLEGINQKDPKVKAQKEIESMPNFVKADSSFSKLIKKNPSWPTAYFWRGRSSSNLDPKNEKWLAKPYYEKVLSLVKPEERTTTYKSNVIESSEYLGDHYFHAKDKAKADEMWNTVKELDPANPKAKAYFAPPKPGGK